jgi:hypothetical protein
MKRAPGFSPQKSLMRAAEKLAYFSVANFNAQERNSQRILARKGKEKVCRIIQVDEKGKSTGELAIAQFENLICTNSRLLQKLQHLQYSNIIFNSIYCSCEIDGQI